MNRVTNTNLQAWIRVFLDNHSSQNQSSKNTANKKNQGFFSMFEARIN